MQVLKSPNKLFKRQWFIQFSKILTQVQKFRSNKQKDHRIELQSKDECEDEIAKSNIYVRKQWKRSQKMLESSISQNTLQFVSQRVFECICHLSHWGDPGEKPVLRNNTDIPGIDIVG